jgi:GT2 family glycosyltransferase
MNLAMSYHPQRIESFQEKDFEPIRILEVELAEPLPAVSAYDAESQKHYWRAQSLVRLHGQPLGLVEFSLDENRLSPEAYASQLWCALNQEINLHLQQEGLPTVARLEPGGLPGDCKPRCVRERETFLSKAPFVSIVIATRDRPGALTKCLDSLLALEYPAYNIIVVDNAPNSSATAELIQQKYCHLQSVLYVREDHPGLAEAHNRGLAEVKSSFVAFTDDDVIVDKHWLAELMRGFYRAEDVACVTGLILPAELETPAQVWFEQFGGFSKGFNRRIFDRFENRLKSPLYPYAAGTFGSGANMAFKTAALWDIGGFDPALGAGTIAQGGDDLAAFYSVITRGYRLVYEPAALVYHWHGRDYAGLRRRAYGYGVGLTAYLTKYLVDQPNLFLKFAWRVPFGLAYVLNPSSTKNTRKGLDYPKELTRLERKGMLSGPIAYLRSRWQAYKLQQQLVQKQDVPDHIHYDRERTESTVS